MSSQLTFACPQCGKPIKADPAAAGRQGECPHCNNSVTVPVPQSTQVVPTATIPPRRPPKLPVVATGGLLAGWICLGIGAILMAVLVLVPVYVPLFIGSFVLGFIALTRGRTVAGLALLLCSIIVPVVIAIVGVAIAGTILFSKGRAPGVQQQTERAQTASPQAKPKPPNQALSTSMVSHAGSWSWRHLSNECLQNGMFVMIHLPVAFTRPRKPRRSALAITVNAFAHPGER